MNVENTDTVTLRGASWNKVYIIESLRPEDRRLGVDLYNTMVQENAKGNWTQPFYRYCRTRRDFLDALERIRAETEADGALPLIHIEIHGGTGGCNSNRVRGSHTSSLLMN